METNFDLITKLEEWGIKTDNHYPPEYLLESNENYCIFVGRVPLSLRKENRELFDQNDYCYTDVLNKKISKRLFLSVEDRYLDFLNEIWHLNSNISVYVDRTCFISKNNIAFIDPKYKRILYKIYFSKKRCYQIQSIDELVMWNQICLRDVAIPTFILEPLQILVSPCWSSYMVFSPNNSSLGLIKEVSKEKELVVSIP